MGALAVGRGDQSFSLAFGPAFASTSATSFRKSSRPRRASKSGSSSSLGRAQPALTASARAALRPVGPYPVLVLNGEQSSGESTLARILRLLIDPHTCPVLALPSSTENLTDLPRLADYDEWGEATSRGLGWGTDTFITTYKDNSKEATQILLEDSPVATVVIALARKGVDWSGKPQDLYNAVVKVTGQTLGPRWPQNNQQVWQRIAPHCSPASTAWNLHQF